MYLYNTQKAPNPRRVRIFLAEKGIDVETREIDLVKRDHCHPDFLKINPRGIIPVLVLDDGTVIDESVAICRYFEALHPDPNLFGTNPQEIGLIESWHRRLEFDGLSNIAMAFRNHTPFFKDRVASGYFPDCEQKPDLVERGMKLAKHFYGFFDQHLQGKDYVTCDRFTVADILGVVMIDFGRWIKLSHNDYPNICKWYEKNAARPSMKA